MTTDQIFKEGFLQGIYQERPATAVNFGFAKFHKGHCYLRLDDKNPSGEDEVYVNSIEDLVHWLGLKPFRITYSSDYFDQLYEFAEALILIKKKARGDFGQRGVDETDASKKGAARYACAHRTRPVSESLTKFRAMRDGKYRARKAALRMKQDLASANPQMWDVFGYRIMEDDEGNFCKHMRTGIRWKIYPTYDFAHCLCDSFEAITHALCTPEFETVRESYELPSDELGVYKPMQREYGPLNVSGTILSKRRLITLIEGNGPDKPNRHKYVRGWDDPRLFTLVGLRRRGIPPTAILSFVSGLEVTKALSTIEIPRFENAVRSYLETTVPRLMLLLDPIRVIIEDLPDDYSEVVEVPYSKDPNHGVRLVPFTKTVYIDRSDFREVASKSSFRLSIGRSVRLLRVPFPITATSCEKDFNTGLVTTVFAKYDKPDEGSAFKKPKVYIHWVGESRAHNSPIRAEVRAFNRPFKSANPATHPDGFLADINPNSEEIFPNGLIDIGFEEVRRRAP